eukprot:Rmarinus@m.25147
MNLDRPVYSISRRTRFRLCCFAQIVLALLFVIQGISSRINGDTFDYTSIIGLCDGLALLVFSVFGLYGSISARRNYLLVYYIVAMVIVVFTLLFATALMVERDAILDYLRNETQAMSAFIEETNGVTAFEVFCYALPPFLFYSAYLAMDEHDMVIIEKGVPRTQGAAYMSLKDALRKTAVAQSALRKNDTEEHDKRLHRKKHHRHHQHHANTGSEAIPYGSSPKTKQNGEISPQSQKSRHRNHHHRHHGERRRSEPRAQGLTKYVPSNFRVYDT